jgi:hypothetical protein
MAYKVLGQTTSTAPSTAATIVNLIQDPSFETVSKATVDTFGAFTSTNLRTIQGTPWKATVSSTTGPFNLARGSSLGIAAQSGNESLGLKTASSTSAGPNIYLTQGVKEGIAYNALSGNGALDLTTAIALKPSTTYYFGFNALRTTTSFDNMYMQISTWNGVSSNEQTNAFQTATVNPTINTWTSASTSFTTPGTSSASLFASVILSGSSASVSGHNAVLYDSVWLSTSSTYSSTFPNPYNTTNITAPFTDRGVNFVDTFNTSVSQQSYASAMTDLYTVPAGSSAVVSTIVVNDLLRNSKALANSTWSDTTNPIRIAVVPSGQTLDKKHFIVFDAPMAANGTQTFTIGMTLAAGDKIKVSADSADVAFTAFGNES